MPKLERVGKKYVRQFSKSKETKGAVQYKEEHDNPVVRTIYLRKPAAEKLGDTIKVTVEEAS